MLKIGLSAVILMSIGIVLFSLAKSGTQYVVYEGTEILNPVQYGNFLTVLDGTYGEKDRERNKVYYAIVSDIGILKQISFKAKVLGSRDFGYGIKSDYEPCGNYGSFIGTLGISLLMIGACFGFAYIVADTKECS